MGKQGAAAEVIDGEGVLAMDWWRGVVGELHEATAKLSRGSGWSGKCGSSGSTVAEACRSCERGTVVCAGEKGSARLFIGQNLKGMSTRRVWGSSWTGEEDELTMLLVFPWAPARCRGQGARGGVARGY